MPSIKDYKDWIQNKADEIAMDVYEVEFYDLPAETQGEVYALAEEAYKEVYAGSIDATYEAMRDNLL